MGGDIQKLNTAFAPTSSSGTCHGVVSQEHQRQRLLLKMSTRQDHVRAAAMLPICDVDHKMSLVISMPAMSPLHAGRRRKRLRITGKPP
ncbi:hypothetical protein [Dyella japonica]|uniref:hypothetical protein n=1 Tax=Dyella japonica TaxID=231455 RepID=UPI001186F3B3|nr:hypothetical protein [Dyella japonica]